MTYLNKLLCAILICTSLFLICCNKEQFQSNKEESIEKRVIEKLNKAGFDTSEGVRVFRNGYLVEYDIYLTEAQIDELIKDQNVISQKGKAEVFHYKTNSDRLVSVSGASRNIKVFMDSGFGTYMQNAFDFALARYSNVDMNLTFSRTLNSSEADIKILAFFEDSPTLGLSGGYPSGGHPAKTIELNTFYYNNNNQRPDATTTIAHEIGHAIGFRHTDYMDRTFSCGDEGFNPNEGAGTAGANHITGTPTGPSANSWMLACSNNTDKPFTSTDITAISTVYPYQCTAAPSTPGGITVKTGPTIGCDRMILEISAVRYATSYKWYIDGQLQLGSTGRSITRIIESDGESRFIEVQAVNACGSSAKRSTTVYGWCNM